MPTVEQMIKDNFYLLLTLIDQSPYKEITFYKRKNRVLDTFTSMLIDVDVAYPLRAIITKYKPTETTSLKTLMEVGPITFHVAVSSLPTYSSPEDGLNVEPSVSDYIMYENQKYEIFGWDIAAVRSEYRIHCKRTDYNRQ